MRSEMFVPASDILPRISAIVMGYNYKLVAHQFKQTAQMWSLETY